MKDDNVYLIHVLECIRQIEEYTINGYEEFIKSRLIQDAVIRNMEIIGEATKRVSPGFVSNILKSHGRKWQACGMY